MVLCLYSTMRADSAITFTPEIAVIAADGVGIRIPLIADIAHHRIPPSVELLAVSHAIVLQVLNRQEADLCLTTA